MSSLQAKSYKLKAVRGFTLIELLVVLGIVAALSAIVPVFDLTSYRARAVERERSTIVALLTHARSQAMANLQARAHGVAIMPPDASRSYVLFTGDTYETSDRDSRAVFEQEYPLLFANSSPREIIFEQLSGSVLDANGDPLDADINASAPGGGGSFIVTINHEGAIK